jgi:hypothetical protein
MGHYVRVLSTSAECIPLSILEGALHEEGREATLTLEAGTSDDWQQLLLKHSDGREIASIERNPVAGDNSLGSEELEEFAEEIQNYKPASAVDWLGAYFPSVQCIYAFQVLSGTSHKDGWEILGTVKTNIWSSTPAIMQADMEGFSNEDGYHILWQFDDSVDGEWWMGILEDERWTHFQMDLGNDKHRQAFLSGRVPKGVCMA